MNITLNYITLKKYFLFFLKINLQNKQWNFPPFLKLERGCLPRMVSTNNIPLHILRSNLHLPGEITVKRNIVTGDKMVAHFIG